MSVAPATTTNPLDLSEKDVAERRQRKLKKMQSVQFSPATSLPMQLFMLWMAGNDIQMFSIMITGNAIYSPISQIFKTNEVFAAFQGDEEVREELWKSKLIYIAMCLVALCVGLAKLHYMGLLPTAAVDWLDHTPPQYTVIAKPGY